MAASQSGLQSGIQGISSNACFSLQSLRPLLKPSTRRPHPTPEPSKSALPAVDSTKSLKLTLESLEPNGTLSREETAEEDFPRIQAWFEDTEAGYVIYFLDPPCDEYIFISFVPETTNVRSKMLYAASRSTLIASLGLRTQRLKTTIIATTKGELVFPKEDDIPSTGLGELSIREKELLEIKAAEAEGAHGTSKRTNYATSTGMSFPISDEAKEAITALSTDEGDNLVQLYIKDEVVALASTHKISKGEEITSLLSPSEPQYTFFRFPHDYKGTGTSSTIFVYSCPASSSIKHRMLYASNRVALVFVAAELGVKLDAKIETGDVEELSLKYLTREVHGEEIVEEKKTFARPRGPPKRNQKVGNGGSGTE